MITQIYLLWERDFVTTDPASGQPEPTATDPGCWF
jgi:hypothetical protein